jgi:hypothetical protein
MSQQTENYKRAIENAEFRVTFTETNLRYLLGDANPKEDAIAKSRKQLEDAKAKLEFLRANQWSRK